MKSELEGWIGRIESKKPHRENHLSKHLVDEDLRVGLIIIRRRTLNRRFKQILDLCSDIDISRMRLPRDIEAVVELTVLNQVVQVLSTVVATLGLWVEEDPGFVRQAKKDGYLTVTSEEMLDRLEKQFALWKLIEHPERKIAARVHLASQELNHFIGSRIDAQDLWIVGSLLMDSLNHKEGEA